MTKRYDDLTIDEVMADPMIRKVMRADKVEPRRLEFMLRTMASVAEPVRPRPVGPSLAMAASPPSRLHAATCGLACSW